MMLGSDKEVALLNVYSESQLELLAPLIMNVQSIYVNKPQDLSENLLN